MVKAIETQYKGYRFRSRLEAKWAVFFDALQIRWDYELEGFDLGNAGWYLPDFWLPDYHCWFEIKGGEEAVSEAVVLRLKVLCEDLETSGAIACGLPDSNHGSVRWAECLRCGYIFPVGVTLWVCPVPGCTSKHESFHPLTYCGCSTVDETQGVTEITFESERLKYAYRAARGARFEHGESPNL
jgi:hypothetical protein